MPISGRNGSSSASMGGVRLFTMDECLARYGLDSPSAWAELLREAVQNEGTDAVRWEDTTRAPLFRWFTDNPLFKAAGSSDSSNKYFNLTEISEQGRHYGRCPCSQFSILFFILFCNLPCVHLHLALASTVALHGQT